MLPNNCLIFHHLECIVTVMCNCVYKSFVINVFGKYIYTIKVYAYLTYHELIKTYKVFSIVIKYELFTLISAYRNFGKKTGPPATRRIIASLVYLKVVQNDDVLHACFPPFYLGLSGPSHHSPILLLLSQHYVASYTQYVAQ